MKLGTKSFRGIVKLKNGKMYGGLVNMIGNWVRIVNCYVYNFVNLRWEKTHKVIVHSSEVEKITEVERCTI